MLLFELKTSFKTTYKEFDIFLYLDVGKHFSDEELLELRSVFHSIKERSGYEVKAQIHDVEDLQLFRAIVSSMLITLIKQGETYIRFTVSPHFDLGHSKLLHVGLSHSVPSRTLEGYLKDLTIAYMAAFAYRQFGSLYISTITLIPYFVELFNKVVPNSWPNPDKDLRQSPLEFRKVFRVLRDKYIVPSLHFKEIDERRFVLIEEDPTLDGYTVAFSKIPRPHNYQYLSFCKTWLDYSNFENIILIGKFSWVDFIKTKWMIFKIAAASHGDRMKHILLEGRKLLIKSGLGAE